MGDQRVDQRSGPVPGGGMYDQPLRLVDNDDVVILINHVERDCFGGGLGGGRLRHVDDDRGAGIDAMAGITDRAPVDGDGAGFDQRLEPRAREFGNVRSKHAVEPAAGLVVNDVDRFFRGCHLQFSFWQKSSGTRMVKLAAAEPQGEWEETGTHRSDIEADTAAAGLAARVRLMMIISGLTTLIAIAAVVSVIGSRVFHSGGSGGPVAEAIVTLPNAARMIATAVTGDRIVVTLDIGGGTANRTFDVKDPRETGRIRFATEP